MQFFNDASAERKENKTFVFVECSPQSPVNTESLCEITRANPLDVGTCKRQKVTQRNFSSQLRFSQWCFSKMIRSPQIRSWKKGKIQFLLSDLWACDIHNCFKAVSTRFTDWNRGSCMKELSFGRCVGSSFSNSSSTLATNQSTSVPAKHFNHTRHLCVTKLDCGCDRVCKCTTRYWFRRTHRVVWDNRWHFARVLQKRTHLWRDQNFCPAPGHQTVRKCTKFHHCRPDRHENSQMLFCTRKTIFNLLFWSDKLCFSQRCSIFQSFMRNLFKPTTQSNVDFQISDNDSLKLPRARLQSSLTCKHVPCNQASTNHLHSQIRWTRRHCCGKNSPDSKGKQGKHQQSPGQQCHRRENREEQTDLDHGNGETLGRTHTSRNFSLIPWVCFVWTAQNPYNCRPHRHKNSSVEADWTLLCPQCTQDAFLIVWTKLEWYFLLVCAYVLPINNILILYFCISLVLYFFAISSICKFRS